MKEIFILIIFSFIIQKSTEFEPKRDYLIRMLDYDDEELSTYNGTEPDTDPEEVPETQPMTQPMTQPLTQIKTEEVKEKYHKQTKTKPVLKGFNLIKKEEKKDDGPTEPASLIVFFKNVGDKSVFKKYIYFYITIITNRVRVLENQNQTLVKGVLNENSLSSYNVEYIVKET